MDVGSRLGNYEILGQLGQGGMGTVYRARQLSMDRDVALKLLSPHLATDRQFIERFQREAQSAAAINHPHLINIIECGSIDGRYFFSMEFVPGATLAEAVAERGPLPESDVIPLLRQTAEALQAAHDKGIVHRDVKPDNIMLDSRQEAKLADLGLAKPISGEADVTIGGVAVGTPHFLSPEQAKGEDTDERADIYSLGATAHYLLTGQTLFTGGNAGAIAVKHVTEQPTPVRRICPSVSAGLERVILRCLAKEPAARYRDCRTLITDLDLVEGGGQPSTTTLPVQQRATGSLPAAHRRTDTRLKRRRVRQRKQASTLVALFVVGMVIMIAVVVFYRQDQPAIPGVSDAPAYVEGGGSRPTPNDTTATDTTADLEHPAWQHLGRAREHLLQHPAEFDTARRLGQDALRLQPEPKAEERIRNFLDYVDEQEALFHRQAWQLVEHKARMALAQQQFDDAIAALDGLAAESRRSVKDEYLALSKEIRVAASRAIIDLINASRQAMRRGDYAGAREKLAAIDEVAYSEGIKACADDRAHLTQQIAEEERKDLVQDRR